MKKNCGNSGFARLTAMNQGAATSRKSALRRIAPNPARRGEQLHLARNGLGHIHVAAVLPEFGIVAFGLLVVQDQEVADLLEFVGAAAVVFFALG